MIRERIYSQLAVLKHNGNRPKALLITKKIERALAVESLKINGPASGLPFGKLTWFAGIQVIVGEDVSDLASYVAHIHMVDPDVQLMLVHDEEGYWQQKWEGEE